MARPSKLTDHQWGRIAEEFDLNGLIQESMMMCSNERSVTLMLRLVLACGDLPRMLAVPAISGYRFEFPVGGGRIDLLLFHVDGSVSIVEAKAQGLINTVIAAGIGQLCMYAAALPRALHAKQQPTVIRRILCAHVPPEDCGDLIPACEMAGARFAYLPPFETFQTRMHDMLSKVSNGS